MRFGWQGFQIEHPEDWSPESLSGDRSGGYACLGAGEGCSLQIRWQTPKSRIDLSQQLATYLERLSKDAKKAGCGFHSDSQLRHGRLIYRYHTDRHGRGALFQGGSDPRVFFIEMTSTKKSGLTLSSFRECLDSFNASSSDGEDWSLLGLHIRLPEKMTLESRELLAGKTTLRLSAKGASLSATRWGFAEQLIAKHEFEPWARAALNLPNAKLTLEECGLRITQSHFLRSKEAIVKHDVFRNQIVSIQVVARDSKWRPNWDWIL